MHFKSVIFAELIAVLLLASCQTFSVPQYKIPEEENIEGTVRIVQISDFHSNDFGKNEKPLIEKINSLEPDLIVFTGDIFEYKFQREKTIGNIVLLLDGIKDSAPIYFVAGNHEYYYGHECEDAILIENAGGKILFDEAVALDTESGVIILAGLFDPLFDLTKAERLEIKRSDNRGKYFTRLKLLAQKTAALKKQKISEGKKIISTVLLAHRPEYIEEYKKYDFDLILSGHAHGGQVRLPWTQNGLYAPGQGFFPKYSGGHFVFGDAGESGNQKIDFIISRGLSYQVPDFPRIFNKSEIVVIDLNIKKEKQN